MPALSVGGNLAGNATLCGLWRKRGAWLSVVLIASGALAPAVHAQPYIQPTFRDIPAIDLSKRIKWLSASKGGGRLQCVPYARRVSGIKLRGDAWRWWDKAKGRYVRGSRPRVGAVMALKPHGQMQLGHVAAVSKLVDKRTILLRHANWSLIDGERGQIENDVRAVDVSQANDWSAVRIWYAPLQNLGATDWPVQGFIYNAVTGPVDVHGISADAIGRIIAAAASASASGLIAAKSASRGHHRARLGFSISSSKTSPRKVQP